MMLYHEIPQGPRIEIQQDPRFDRLNCTLIFQVDGIDLMKSRELPLELACTKALAAAVLLHQELENLHKEPES